MSCLHLEDLRDYRSWRKTTKRLKQISRHHFVNGDHRFLICVELTRGPIGPRGPCGPLTPMAPCRNQKTCHWEASQLLQTFILVAHQHDFNIKRDNLIRSLPGSPLLTGGPDFPISPRSPPGPGGPCQKSRVSCSILRHLTAIFTILWYQLLWRIFFLKKTYRWPIWPNSL